MDFRASIDGKRAVAVGLVIAIGVVLLIAFVSGWDAVGFLALTVLGVVIMFGHSRVRQQKDSS